MERLLDRLLDVLDTWFERLPDRVLRNKIWIWGAFALLIAVAIPGVGQFGLQSGNDAYFGKNDPIKKAYDNFRLQFGSTDAIYVVYKAKDGDILSEQSLLALQGVQNDILNFRLDPEGAQKFPEFENVRELRTIINVPYLETKDNSLIARQFIGSNIPRTEQQKEAVRKEALSHEGYYKTFVTDDRQYGGFVIRTKYGKLIETAKDSEFSDLSDNEFAAFDSVAAVNDDPEFETDLYTQGKSDMVNQLWQVFNKPEYAGVLEFYPSGEAPISAFLHDNMVRDILINVAAMLSIILVLAYIYRSPSAVIWPVLIVGASVLSMISMMGWFRVVMTDMFIMAIVLTWVCGICNTIHILSAYITHRSEDMDHMSALRTAYRKTGLASFLTSFTSAVGFLSLVFVPIVPLKNVGIFAAYGVMLAFTVANFLLPLMLTLWNPVGKNLKKEKVVIVRHQQVSGRMTWVAKIVDRRPGAVLTVFAVVTGVFIYGASRAEIDANIVNWFPENSSVRASYELANTKMMGAESVEILIDTHKGDALKDPKVLNIMADIQNYALDNHPEKITRAYSLVEIVKRTHMSINNNDRRFYTIPQEREILEEMIFLFTNADTATRVQWVSDDYSIARIHMSFRNAGNKAEEAMMADLQAYIDGRFRELASVYPKIDATVTGSVVLRSRLENFVTWNQLGSFGSALLVISALLIFSFGSVRAGMLAIVPNLFPVLAFFGLQGLFGVPMTFLSAMTAPVLLGIAVDDTVHFVSHYRQSLKEGANISGAIHKTFSETGMALVFTTVIIAIGFGVMTTHHLNHISNMGMFMALSIIIALLAELFLLSALLKTFNIDFKERRRKETLVLNPTTNVEA